MVWLLDSLRSVFRFQLLLLPSCATWGKLPNLFGSQLPLGLLWGSHDINYTEYLADKSPFPYLVLGWLWAYYGTSPSVDFLIYKMGENNKLPLVLTYKVGMRMKIYLYKSYKELNWWNINMKYLPIYLVLWFLSIEFYRSFTYFVSFVFKYFTLQVLI